jgi:hypothetical protein
MLKWLFSFLTNKHKLCDCDMCTGRLPNTSRSPYVSHGLHMEVGEDGKIHYWSKSRVVELY